MGTYIPWVHVEGRGQLSGAVLSFQVWVPGVELSSSGLAGMCLSSLNHLTSPRVSILLSADGLRSAVECGDWLDSAVCVWWLAKFCCLYLDCCCFFLVCFFIFCLFVFKQWVFLPDQDQRSQLILPPPIHVDYRAACFCHRSLIEIGYVCSVCLSSKLTCSFFSCLCWGRGRHRM